MNNKTIIEFGLISYDVNNYAELGGWSVNLSEGTRSSLQLSEQ